MGGQGEAIVDCGAFPGVVDRAFLLVSATGLVSTSQHEAWIQPEVTADHSVDEHMHENIKAVSTYFADNNLLVFVVNDNRLVEPIWDPNGNTAGGKQDVQTYNRGGTIPRVYGQWNVGWVWN